MVDVRAMRAFSLLAMTRRLAVALCVILVGALAFSPKMAFAATTQYQALSACQAVKADPSKLAPSQQWWTCDLVTSPFKAYCLPVACNVYVFYFDTDGGFPNNCASVKPSSGAYSGNLSAGSSMCQSQPDGSGCSMSFKPDSAPFLNRSGTAWATHGTYSPSGGQCTPGPVGGDPNGAPAPPTVPSKSCAGGSCYDSANDQYCAVDGGGSQVCVPGKAARSPSGACVSSGSATVCAGTPRAPAPPSPPASPISDPSTEIKSSDNYTSKGDAGNQTTAVNVFSPGNSKTGSGQGTGDDGPAKASSSAGSGSASGGADCNSPPACSGDAVMCGVLRQQWLTRCGPDKTDKNGNGQPDWTEVSDSDGDQYNVAPTDSSKVFKSETIDTSNIDQTSWAGNTCPDLGSAEIFGTSWTPDTTLFCKWLSFIRGAVLLGGAILSVIILVAGAKD